MSGDIFFEWLFIFKKKFAIIKELNLNKLYEIFWFQGENAAMCADSILETEFVKVKRLSMWSLFSAIEKGIKMGKAKNSKNKITNKKNLAKRTNKKKKMAMSKEEKVGLIVGLSVLFGFVIIIIIFVIVNEIKMSAERNRDYFINTEENISVDCNLHEEKLILQCGEIEISGEYSNYDTVSLSVDGEKVETEKNIFNQKVHKELSDLIYQRNDFDINALKNTESKVVSISLYNKILDKEVLNKKVNIEFKINQSDKELLAQKNQEWKIKKAEEEARKQAEAEQKRIEEEQRKAEEAQRKAEEERKVAEEKAAKEAAEKSTFPKGENQTALDVCTDKFYYANGISIVPTLKYLKDSFWSTEDYKQMIVIMDTSKGIRLVCKYDWKEKTATITDWNFF